MRLTDRQFQPRLKTLDPIHVARSAHILTSTMVHGLMSISCPTPSNVRPQFIRVDRTTQFHVLDNDWLQGALANVWNNIRHHIPVALQHPAHHGLVWSAATALPTSRATSDGGLVGLYLTIRRVFYRLLWPCTCGVPGHAPSRLVGDVQPALQFLSGNSVSGSREQKHRVEPLVKWQVRALHWRPDGRVKAMTAVLVHIPALFSQTIELGKHTALRAVQFSSTVTLNHDALQTRLIVKKLFLYLIERCDRGLLSPVCGYVKVVIACLNVISYVEITPCDPPISRCNWKMHLCAGISCKNG